MNLRNGIRELLKGIRGGAKHHAGKTLPRLGRRLERLGGALQTRFESPDSADSGEAEESTKKAHDPKVDEFEQELDEALNFEQLEVLEDAPMPTPATPGGIPPCEVPDEVSIEEALEYFADWVRGATGSYGVFIADSQGLPLVSRYSIDDHVAISAALDQALTPIRASLEGDAQGSASIEIDGENVLQVIWVNTNAGRFAIGLIVPQSLAGDIVDTLRGQLAPIFIKRGNAA